MLNLPSLRNFWILLFVLSIAACSPGEVDRSDGPPDDAAKTSLKLAASQYKDNKALFFAGSGDHKEFLAEVIPVVASWFDEQDVGFQSTHFADLTVAEIKENISETAASMSKDGTLAIYFLTHGSPDGYMLAKDRIFRMSEIFATLKSARKTPLKRLFVFVETCYSGNQINAFGLADERVSPGELPLELADDDPLLEGLTTPGLSLAGEDPFLEAIIVTSAKNNQVSNVPLFSNALYLSFLDYNFQDDATIRQCLGKVKEHTLANAPTPQEPPFKGLPDSVLDKKLWMNDRKPEPGGSELSSDLLNNTITPDGITDAQRQAADSNSGKKNVDNGKLGNNSKVDKEEDGSLSSDDDDAGDENNKDANQANTKKSPKARKSDNGKGSRGGAPCGTVAGEPVAPAATLMLFLLALLAPLVASMRPVKAAAVVRDQ